MKNYRVWEANRKVFLYPGELDRARAARRQDVRSSWRSSRACCRTSSPAPTVEREYLNYLKRSTRSRTSRSAGIDRRMGRRARRRCTSSVARATRRADYSLPALERRRVDGVGAGRRRHRGRPPGSRSVEPAPVPALADADGRGRAKSTRRSKKASTSRRRSRSTRRPAAMERVPRRRDGRRSRSAPRRCRSIAIDTATRTQMPFPARLRSRVRSSFWTLFDHARRDDGRHRRIRPRNRSLSLDLVLHAAGESGTASAQVRTDWHGLSGHRASVQPDARRAAPARPGCGSTPASGRRAGTVTVLDRVPRPFTIVFQQDERPFFCRTPFFYAGPAAQLLRRSGGRYLLDPDSGSPLAGEITASARSDPCPAEPGDAPPLDLPVQVATFHADVARNALALVGDRDAVPSPAPRAVLAGHWETTQFWFQGHHHPFVRLLIGAVEPIRHRRRS